MLELTRHPTGLPLLLLLRNIVTDQVFCPLPNSQWSHQALLVRENIDPDRWHAIVQLIRQHYRYQEFPLYEKRHGKWKTIR